ncbi:MAG: cyclic nucleotide-binding domain-containing protein [bacterium]
MFLQRVELFKDLPQAVLGEISSASEEIAVSRGDFPLRAGQPAQYLYVLAEGRARVTIGEKAHIHFLSCDPGDIFGWPSLVDRPTYTASVECLEDCKFLRIPRERLAQILAKDPSSQATFYKRLAGIIGQRLISAYETVLAAYREQGPPSYG